MPIPNFSVPSSSRTGHLSIVLIQIFLTPLALPFTSRVEQAYAHPIPNPSYHRT